MPTIPPTPSSPRLRPSPSPTMAVVLDFPHHQPHSKPWKRRCRLLSFPHHDPNNLSADLSSSPATTPNLSSPASRSPRFNRSISTPCFSTTTPPLDSHDRQSRQQDRITRVEIIGSCHAKGTQALVVETAIALASGALPVPASSGLGGAFFLHGLSGECLAVIKPIGDEPVALSSILGRPAGSRLSVYASETGLREVAAYLLDHDGFSGVPPTALIKICYPALQMGSSSPASAPPAKKVASIQRFVPHDCDAGDLGPSRFSVTSVHRIGILDVRLLNIDRHAGNILVRKSSPSAVAELVPIDHGLCLPELLEDPYFEWLHWPQATVPFTEAESEYISALDPFKDAALLRSEIPSLKEPAIRILILCTIFLKRAAAGGLCLADIGGMMTRDLCGLEEEPSMLEALCKQAEASVKTRSSNFFIGRSSGEESEYTDCDDSDDDHDDDGATVQFEMECDDAEFTKSYIGDVLDIPLFLRSRKEKVVLGTLSEEEDQDEDESDYDEGDDRIDDEKDEPKLGSITKSLSLTAAQLNFESGGSSSGKCISFSRMSEEEWDLFMERFQQLLPEAIEATKSLGLKQRLGTSCKF